TTPSPDPGQEVQPGQTSGSESDIVVTGVRASIERAQEIKRRAATVVEAIASEDIGKFSDPSIGDALQRVPGLQLQRNDDVNSGDRVSIRGLGPAFVSVTLNGRDTLSYGDLGGNQRQFNFDAVPAETLSGVLIYKTAQASQVEPGIAGQVDLQTIRPLDQNTKGRHVFGTLSVQGAYDDIRKGWSPRINGIIGGKFLDDKIGFYIAGSYTKQKLRQDAFTVDYVERTIRTTDLAGNLVTYPNILAPSTQNFLVQINDRKRLDFNGALQFKPDDHLNVVIDGAYNKYDIDQDNPALRAAGDGAGTVVGTFPIGAYEIKNRGLVYQDQSRVEYNIPGEQLNTGGNFVVPQNLLSRRRINQYNAGINISWTNDDWTIKSDYGFSKVIAKENSFGGIVFSVPDKFTYDGRDAKRPVLTLLTDTYLQVFDPTVFTPSYDFGGASKFDSERHAFRLDVTRAIAFGDGWEATIKTGVRGSRTTV
ncbi:MAG: hypothetical protein EOO39_33595, partial [Cytophagaceae bacterium]